MKKTIPVSFCLFVFLFGFISTIHAKSHYQYIHDPKADVYFGHISYTEVKHDGNDPFVLREGKTAPEAAVLNLPIAPGDTITTTDSRRCEIQFDTGTIVRLDTDTELKVETILAQSLSTHFKLSNLILNKGQVYIMYKKYASPEVFQILSSNASVKLRHNTVLMMRANTDGSTDLRVNSGKASVLYGLDEASVEQETIRKSQELNVTAEHTIKYREYKNTAEFDLWNQNLNENFAALHEGVSALPRPVQRLSPAVFYFAQKFSNIYGEWVWNDLYGYVWRPFVNDRYPSGDWQPYYYGHWREINGKLFWVPLESWGWVPYHLGLWIWDKKHGWLWIPGSAFAPAWAQWNMYRGFYCWSPWSLWDWYYYRNPYFDYNWMPFFAYFNAFDFDPRTTRTPPPEGIPSKRPILYKINKNQLKKKGTAPFNPPKNLRRTLRNMVKALNKGDPRILESLKSMPNSAVIVSLDKINSVDIHAYALPFKKLDPNAQIGLMLRNRQKDPSRSALRAFRRSEILSSIGKNLAVTKAEKTGETEAKNQASLRSVPPAESLQGATKGRPSGMLEMPAGRVTRFEHLSKDTSPTARFRDWNPDVREAVRQGVTINYSARDNMVHCPELGLSSHNVSVRSGSSARGGFYRASRSSVSSGTAGSVSSSSSSSSSVSRGSASSGSRSSGSSSSGSTSSGSKGAVKK
jgi:hypothetical protein